MANIEKIVLPDNTEYDVKDATAIHGTFSDNTAYTSNGWTRLRAKGGSTDPSRFDLLDQNGTMVASLSLNSSENIGRLYTYKTDGTTNASGVYMEQTPRVILFANAGDVVLRPNGLSSTTGQFVVNSNGDITVNGQIYGGVTETTKSSTSSVSCTGTTWATAVSVTGLSSTGYYIAVGQLTYNPNSSSGHTPRCRLITAGGTELAQQCVYMAVNTSVPFNVFGMMHGSTGFTLQCSPQASAITNGTISSGAKLTIFRVG